MFVTECVLSVPISTTGSWYIKGHLVLIWRTMNRASSAAVARSLVTAQATQCRCCWHPCCRGIVPCAPTCMRLCGGPGGRKALFTDTHKYCDSCCEPPSIRFYPLDQWPPLLPGPSLFPQPRDNVNTMSAI